MEPDVQLEFTKFLDKLNKSFQHQQSEFQAEKNELQAKSNHLEAEKKEIEAENDRLKTQLHEEVLAKKAAQSVATDLTNRNEALVQELEDKERALQNQAEKLDDVEKVRVHLQHEYDCVHKRLSELEDERKNRKKPNSSLKYYRALIEVYGPDVTIPDNPCICYLCEERCKSEIAAKICVNNHAGRAWKSFRGFQKWLPIHDNKALEFLRQRKERMTQDPITKKEKQALDDDDDIDVARPQKRIRRSILSDDEEEMAASAGSQVIQDSDSDWDPSY